MQGHFAFVFGVVLLFLAPLSLAARCDQLENLHFLEAGCDREYLLLLANQNKNNLVWHDGKYKSGFHDKQSDPSQWAAIGFNRRVQGNPATQFRTLNNQNYKNTGEGAESFSSAYLFTATAFLRKFVPNDFVAGDIGNLKTKDRRNAEREFFVDPFAHTERQLRNEVANAISLMDPNEREISVYVYSYSTPCYYGCTPDVFKDSPRSLANKVQAKVPGKPLKLFLGFHAQYRGNDDWHAWVAFQEYMQYPGENVDKRWAVMALEGTFQTFLAQRLASFSQFCAACTLEDQGTNYLPDEPPRTRAIRYLIDTVLFYFQTVFYPEEEAVLDREPVYFRSPKDWLDALKIITPDPNINAVHAKIFGVALRNEPNDDTKFFFTPQIVKFQKVNVADEGDTNYGRGLSIGPPSARKQFFVDLVQTPFAQNRWLVQCLRDTGYTGLLCENKDARLDPMLQIRKYVGFFDERNLQGWKLFERGPDLQTKGIMINTKVTTRHDGGPKFLEVIAISGGQLSQVFQEIAGVKSAVFLKPKYDPERKIFFYSMTDSNLPEISSLVAILKATFCTLHALPATGGTIDRLLCHDPVNPTYLNSFFSKVTAKSVAERLLTTDGTATCLLPLVPPPPTPPPPPTTTTTG